jgi:tetratricopeptide (TPR) repeat protein
MTGASAALSPRFRHRISVVTNRSSRSARSTLDPRHLVALFAFVATGCATGPAATVRGEASTADRPAIVLPEQRITATDPAEAPRLFAEASAMLLRGDATRAAAEFDRIVVIDPAGPTAVPSLYNAGVAYAELGDAKSAVDRFRRSAEQDPAATTSNGAWLRILRIHAQLEQWSELEVAARSTLSRQGLTVLERIEAGGAHGLALVSLGRIDEASDVIIRVRNEIEDRKLGQAGVPPPELAQVAFALGELRRVKSEKIVFDPAPADFGATLEARCTGLLDAQGAYTDAMRSRDPHWAAMAGFRVGQLYQHLHRDVMRAPIPTNTTLRKQQLWEGAMRLRYRILLEKGLQMMEGTISLGERTGEQSAWISRARAAKHELEDALSAERDALSKLPYTEDEIRKGLESLKPANAKP